MTHDTSNQTVSTPNNVSMRERALARWENEGGATQFLQTQSISATKFTEVHPLSHKSSATRPAKDPANPLP